MYRWRAVLQHGSVLRCAPATAAVKQKLNGTNVVCVEQCEVCFECQHAGGNRMAVVPQMRQLLMMLPLH